MKQTAMLANKQDENVHMNFAGRFVAVHGLSLTFATPNYTLFTFFFFRLAQFLLLKREFNFPAQLPESFYLS